ncbi:methionine ABC transporter permease [Piscirickettsia salmonis]|uniref:D-methionine transport system permease protein MetI n=1 Tax=Piscirickettsia salmonis TaxID=1238 RepID=A0A9Q5VIA8_PISSA|nr:methionine ABC transporter permease [Piscirickettsia salmonis]RNC78661.1 ABC transporter permease [Piscirickettsiaceae bacterium NZ-RLO2]ALA26295.1 methionine ABC transporter permease [Piscirickettsia salmonis]APS43729.1 methionine ABC transporter permease [Piscirickettsia salmonis]APS47084.1 methionine ABC transporter permease [Piscirickettsia salmonis]APS51472.1 methionine ABC transporter permease [Piscirickettsia salmonis]
MSQATLQLLFSSTLDTVYMVFVAGIIAIALGLPIAIALTLARPGSLYENKSLYRLLSLIVNIGRSVPFIILMVAIIPLTRFIVGTSIGTEAAMVPLSIAAIPYFARIAEGKLHELDHSLIELSEVVGANVWQIITKVMLPEAWPALVNGMTILFVSLIEYSAMAGTIGGSGLGNMAIQYGYYRFDLKVMFLAVAGLVILVLLVQWFGDFIVASSMKHRQRRNHGN